MLPGAFTSEWLWKQENSACRKIEVPENHIWYSHRHRRHKKVIVIESGKASVRVEQTTLNRERGDSISLPKDTWLEIRNIGPQPLQLIEISFSEINRKWYLDEDWEAENNA